MRIEKREIGCGLPPYIVVEISGNHGGDLDKALHLIEIAKWAGADAVKTQCYEPQTLTLDCDSPDFILKDGPWKGRRLFDLYGNAHTPLSWHPRLYEHAHGAGIPIFSSVFDFSSVDLLERLGCPAYKIASMEIVDIPLIRYAAKTGKPLIISTGMSTAEERGKALAASDRNNTAMLHCVSGYPTPVEEAGLWRFDGLKRVHQRVGISDHSLGWEVPIMATAMGACIIEKHLCLSRDDGSEDADFSLEPAEFKTMCNMVRSAWKACRLSDNNIPSEQSSRQLRRSLYVVQDMHKGEHFTPEKVRSIRPGYGLPPEYIDKVIGREAITDIKRGTALTEGLMR